jgi:mono/diheme cytochrome c family protein
MKLFFTIGNKSAREVARLLIKTRSPGGRSAPVDFLRSPIDHYARHPQADGQFRMKNIWPFAAALLLLGACSKEGEQKTAAPVPGIAVRQFDPASITRGARLFEEHCVICHGPQAQGHPDWQTPSDGSFAAAPPLNGTGNDWKRSRAALAATIQNGARRVSDKVDIMPGWKGRFSAGDVEDVLNWLQSLWPAEVYDAWTKTQAAAAPKS